MFASWAVPKGPSTDPRDKRLAMEVEDHELSWGDFEGVIGPGYGAGAVIVWDKGTFKHVGKGSAKDALAKGHMSFELNGEKLKGGYSLRRISEGDKPQWLLVKKKDERGRRPPRPRALPARVGAERQDDRGDRGGGGRDLAGRRDVLVQPEEVVRVVLRLDLRQPVPGRARVGGAHPVLALVAEEADVRAVVVLQQLRR